MLTLVIDSVPYGAEVAIDGVSYGITPVIATINDEVLAEFRAECLSNESVVCSWDVLKTRLEDLTVSQLWWDLTRDERYSISEMAIGNTLTRIYRWGRSGKPNCGGGEGGRTSIVCLNNAVIRYIKFTSNTFGVVDSCYYSEYMELAHDEFCYVPEQTFGLPGHLVSCYGTGFGHTMCAVQIEQDLTTLDSWIVFQYGGFDIKPGDWQMPNGMYVTMHTPTTSIKCSGYSSETIVGFST